MLSNPIFIIGTERSGSNLLRLQLNAHSRIAIPHPPHLMRDFAPLAARYGDLALAENMRRLVRDVVRFVGMHFAPWPFEVTEADLLAAVEVKSLYGVYAALYDLFLAHSGKARWGCKSTFMYKHVGEILENHPAPRFVHLVRDPRDVAASARESIFSKYHPYKQGELWSAQQAEVEKWTHLFDEGKLLRVRYEDLVTSPAQELARIMAFLDEDVEAAQSQHFVGTDAASLAALSESWKNLGAPVSNSSVGRYQKELNPREIAWVEFHARALMDKYGYATEARDFVAAPSLRDLALIESVERYKMLETEARALVKDRNFSLRWKKWFYLKYLNTRSLNG